MKKKYNIINLEQGSGEWLGFREGKVGSSDVPSICGARGAYKSRKAVLIEKQTGKTSGVSAHLELAFKSGHEYEADFRQKFHGGKFKPIVIQSSDNELLIASLDGFCDDVILEVKSTSKKEYVDAIKSHIVPDIYNHQIQYMLYLTGASHALLAVVDKSDHATYVLQVDHALFMQEKIKKELESFLIDLKTPISKDEVVNDDLLKLSQLLIEEKILKDQLEIIDEEKKILSNKILSDLNLKQVSGCGVKIDTVTKKGTVKYDAIPELKNINLELYRSKETTYTTVKLLK